MLLLSLFCLCLVQLCSSVVQDMIAFLSFAVLMMYLWFFSDTLCVSQLRLCRFSRTALYLSHCALFQQDMNVFYSEYALNHDLYPRCETKALQFDSVINGFACVWVANLHQVVCFFSAVKKACIVDMMNVFLNFWRVSSRSLKACFVFAEVVFMNNKIWTVSSKMAIFWSLQTCFADTKVCFNLLKTCLNTY